MSKLLGIDYGSSKVGLALADTETKTAVPLAVVTFDNLRSKIKDLIESEEVEKIVVGLPLGMKGQETEQTKEVKDFIKDLRSKLAPSEAEGININVVAEDERLTTAQAKRDGKDDAVAAMYILQSYIDKHY